MNPEDQQIIKSDEVLRREAQEMNETGDTVNPVTGEPLEPESLQGGNSEPEAPDTKAGDATMRNDFRPEPFS